MGIYVHSNGFQIGAYLKSIEGLQLFGKLKTTTQYFVLFSSSILMLRFVAKKKNKICSRLKDSIN